MPHSFVNHFVHFHYCFVSILYYHFCLDYLIFAYLNQVFHQFQFRLLVHKLLYRKSCTKAKELLLAKMFFSIFSPVIARFGCKHPNLLIIYGSESFPYGVGSVSCPSPDLVITSPFSIISSISASINDFFILNLHFSELHMLPAQQVLIRYPSWHMPQLWDCSLEHSNLS